MKSPLTTFLRNNTKSWPCWFSCFLPALCSPWSSGRQIWRCSRPHNECSRLCMGAPGLTLLRCQFSYVKWRNACTEKSDGAACFKRKHTHRQVRLCAQTCSKTQALAESVQNKFLQEPPFHMIPTTFAIVARLTALQHLPVTPFHWYFLSRAQSPKLATTIGSNCKILLRIVGTQAQSRQ